MDELDSQSYLSKGWYPVAHLSSYAPLTGARLIKESCWDIKDEYLR